MQARVLDGVACGFVQGSGDDDKDDKFEPDKALAWSCGAKLAWIKPLVTFFPSRENWHDFPASK